MSKIEKLEQKLLSMPKDFTFQEAETLLNAYGFRRSEKGKTSGSRVKFVSNTANTTILLHKPHPGNELRHYQLKELVLNLKEGGFLS